MQAAGFVLVGGRSSRMGQDKALLQWNSHPLVEEVAARVRDVAGNVALVGAPGRYQALGLECLPDLRPGLGPLAGIEAALASGRGELNLVVACDMPGLESRWLRTLLECAEQNDALCTLLRDSAGIAHPLCAVYRRACLPVVQRLLRANRLKAQDAARQLNAVMVDIDAELPNINTPEEWRAAREPC
jgi:molybdopterin-guanine dinucleotide biosynthesis protein A